MSPHIKIGLENLNWKSTGINLNVEQKLPQKYIWQFVTESNCEWALDSWGSGDGILV